MKKNTIGIIGAGVGLSVAALLAYKNKETITVVSKDLASSGKEQAEQYLTQAKQIAFEKSNKGINFAKGKLARKELNVNGVKYRRVSK